MSEYPELITVGGIDYEINTDYRYALACFQCIYDPDLSDVERAFGVINILYKQEPEDAQEALRLAIKYLRCGKDDEQAPHEPDMDFEIDQNYIKASFMSDYKIDLDEMDMHWWKFCVLLQGLTDDCILNRIRDIRNYDLSTVHDAKARSKIIRAKQEYKLPERRTEEENDVLDGFYAQLE
jgi:hypothetical protein